MFGKRVTLTCLLLSILNASVIHAAPGPQNGGSGPQTGGGSGNGGPWNYGPGNNGGPGNGGPGNYGPENGGNNSEGASSAAGASSTPAAASTAGASPTLDLASCAAQMNGQLPSPTPSGYEFSGVVRRYYVAAEEVEWDYAPTGWDNWLGVPLQDSPRARQAGALKYGTKWLKALYRGYTDSSFTEKSKQPPWQGTQGPTLRAEVGDLVEIMFVNKLSKNYASMHSMGLAYTKYSEGADYPNNTAPGVDQTIPLTAAVPPVDSGIGPNNCVVYKWMAVAPAGPPPGEPARVHSYHSYVALQQDTNAGLIGPTIIYAKGQMESTMANYREVPLLYMIYSEEDSWLTAENYARLVGGSAGSVGQGCNFNPNNLYSGGNYSVWHPQAVNLAGSGQFCSKGFNGSAPNFYTMNGYIFANNPVFQFCLNDKVIWYVNAYGSASHVFHMHGNGFSYHGFNEYAISLNDGVGKALYMPAAGVGKWQVICHVNNHQTFGMVSDYIIYHEGQCPTNLNTPVVPK